MPIPLTLLTILSSLTLGHSSLPTAKQILTKCQAAYDAVNTFEQDVTATASSTSAKLKTTGHISFSRPGKFRFSGMTSLPKLPKLELVISGKSIDIFNAGQWTKGQTPEMGLATVTGIGCMAPTYVGALLLHTQWGALDPDGLGRFSVSEEKVNGIAAYCLFAGGQMPKKYWIDKKTFFLIKSHGEIMTNNLDVSLGKPTLNQPIPASRFVK